jgi:hypothetical protein
MERSGMSVQVVPADDGTNDHIITVMHNVWELGRCKRVQVIVHRVVTLNLGFGGVPENMLWLLDVLEVTSQVTQSEVSLPKPDTISGTAGIPRDTKATLSRPYLS